MFLLDTDHLGILQRQTEPEFSRLIRRIGEHRPIDFLVPIVSFHEQVSGWNAYLHRALTPEAVVRAYVMFQQILADFSRMAVAPFDAAAAVEFDALRSAGVRVATMDLRIAAIAKSRQWTVLSRNLVDFQRVPGLRVEDWTTYAPSSEGPHLIKRRSTFRLIVSRSLPFSSPLGVSRYIGTFLKRRSLTSRRNGSLPIAPRPMPA